MSRLLLLFALVLLPLQSAWANAARYCGHETGASATRHFGHHEHEHKADTTESDGKTATGTKVFADVDCSVCHSVNPFAMPLSTASGMALGPAAIPSPVPSHPMTSALPRAPDRPKWLRLA